MSTIDALIDLLAADWASRGEAVLYIPSWMKVAFDALSEKDRTLVQEMLGGIAGQHGLQTPVTFVVVD